MFLAYPWCVPLPFARCIWASELRMGLVSLGSQTSYDIWNFQPGTQQQLQETGASVWWRPYSSISWRTHEVLRIEEEEKGPNLVQQGAAIQSQAITGPSPVSPGQEGPISGNHLSSAHLYVSLLFFCSAVGPLVYGYFGLSLLDPVNSQD